MEIRSVLQVWLKSKLYRASRWMPLNVHSYRRHHAQHMLSIWLERSWYMPSMCSKSSNHRTQKSQGIQ